MSLRSTAPVSDTLSVEILNSVFKIPSFRADQHEIVKSIVSGGDHLIIKATGFGKSICYQVPGIVKMAPVVVITPIIALIDDQVSNLVSNGISAGGIHSGMSKSQRKQALKRISSGAMRFIYMSPEMFNFPYVQQELAKCGVSTVVVDEAHCVSQWGSDFRPAYAQIGHSVSELAKTSGTDIQTLAFTATATAEVKKDILEKLKIENAKVIVGSNRRENLTFKVLQSKNKEAAANLVVSLLSKRRGPVIIYCLTIKNIEYLSEVLSNLDISHSIYHGKLDMEERSIAQEDFIAGRQDVIIAIDAFGMGIDKKDVRTVINFGLPMSLEHYIQQAGRAGRDGLDSDCILISQPADKFIHELFLSSQYICPETTLNTYELVRSCPDSYVPAKISDLIAGVLSSISTENKGLLYNSLGFLKNSSYLKLSKVDSNWVYSIRDRTRSLDLDTIKKRNRSAQDKSATMFNYADQTGTCLQVFMERYLFDSSNTMTACGRCSVCCGVPTQFGLRHTSVLRCIQDTGRVYGVTQLKLILKGEYHSLSPSAKKKANIPSFGSLADMHFDDIGHLIKEMVAAQFLSRPNNLRAGISDTKKGIQAMEAFLRQNPSASIAAGGPATPIKVAKVLDRLRERLAGVYGCDKSDLWNDAQNSILADEAPAEMSELVEIDVLSSQQLAVYGEQIIAAIQNLTSLRNSTNL